MIRVGIVGLGGMGSKHLGCYPHVDGAEVVAVADVREGKLRPGDAGMEINIGASEAVIDPDRHRLYRTGMELIDAPDVDMVDVCLPTPMHADHVKAALAADKHVLCEKPMAMTYAACREMIGAAERSPGMLMIAHCVRFFPEYAYLKQTVDSGRLGQLKLLSLWRGGSPPGWSWEHWLLDHARSGGAILDLHIHDADFVHYALGRPRAVCSTGARGPTGGYDFVDTQYVFDHEVAVRAAGTLGLPEGCGFDASFMAAFEGGCLRYSMADGRGLLESVGSETRCVDLPDQDGYVAEIAHFVECIAEGRAPDMVTPDSSAFSVRLAEAEEESIRSGRMVELD